MIGYWLRKLADKLEEVSNGMLDVDRAYTIRVIADVLRDVAKEA